MLSVRSFICTIWCRSRFVFVWYRVLSGIIKQVTRQWRGFSIHHRSASKTVLSVRSVICTIWCRSRFVFVWFTVLSGITKQVSHQRRFFKFTTAARQTPCCQYEALFTQSGLGRESYLYGTGFSQVSSRRLPINDDIFQFITAARRKRCCQYEALFTQSGLGRDSCLYGIGFPQVSSSRLPVNDDAV